MSVTVRDILQLDILSSAEVIAGKNGLDRQVLRVNFTDCPINRIADSKLIMCGDVFIRSFYADKDSEENIYDAISFYIQMGSSCCIALNEFVPQFPESAIELANSRDYPIIHIDGTVSYGALIQNISELIMSDQAEWILENKISRLLDPNLSAVEQSDIFRQLAPHIQSDYAVVHVTFRELTVRRFQMLKKDLATHFELRFLQYSKGGFFILPFLGKEKTADMLDQILPTLSYYDPCCSVGYSTISHGARQFSSAFRQALSADEIGKVMGASRMCYDDLSVYQLLLPLRNHDALKGFCKEVLTPLKNLNLLETVSIYFECNGDVKKTAAILNRHENTVRFRINQAKSELGLEEYEFIEKVSIALKAEKIFSHPEFETVPPISSSPEMDSGNNEKDQT